ncbi:MAG: hypothetical protein HYZ95_03070 [Candidatus Omnitrophica bacterium]|nr:hypothetical protein [Candidatus Omnitrophota bacterium]
MAAVSIVRMAPRTGSAACVWSARAASGEVPASEEPAAGEPPSEGEAPVAAAG